MDLRVNRVNSSKVPWVRTNERLWPKEIGNRSHKRSHKLGEIGVGRIRTISSDFTYNSVAYDPVKTGISDSKAKAEEPTNHKDYNRVL